MCKDSIPACLSTLLNLTLHRTLDFKPWTHRIYDHTTNHPIISNNFQFQFQLATALEVKANKLQTKTKNKKQKERKKKSKRVKKIKSKNMVFRMHEYRRIRNVTICYF